MKQIIFSLGLFCLWASVHAQGNLKDQLKIPDSTTVQIITTTDGSVLNGRIVEIGENEVKFQTNIGIISISISKIKNIKELSSSSVRNGEYWYPNPNTTRLFFAPTAYMVKSGEGYFQDIYVFFVGGSIGITNFLSMGGGMSLIPGADQQAYYITPKVGFKLGEKFNAAVGTLLAGSTGGGETIGIHYGVITYGTTEGSLTGGIGYGYAGGDVASKPVWMIGAQKRMSKNTAFVTENWFIAGSEVNLMSFGIRFLGEHLSADLALWRPLNANTSGFPFFPYVDFVYNFHK